MHSTSQFRRQCIRANEGTSPSTATVNTGSEIFAIIGIFRALLLQLITVNADASGRAVQGVSLRPLACWDSGFESRRGHGCLSLLNVVLSGRGLYDGLITRSDESYRMLCV
jgi:hypothetical protein